MKKVRLDIIILLIAIVGVLFFVIKDDFNEIVNIFLRVKLIYVFLAFLLMLISDAFKSMVIYMETKAFYPDFKYLTAYKLNCISNFINGITPLCSGGEPYQAYYLNKKYKIDLSKTSCIIFQNFFIRQIALIIIFTTFMVINEIYKFIPIDAFLKNLIIIGQVINIGIAVVLFLINFDNKGKHSFIRGFMSFLCKIKIIKEKTVTKFNSYLDNFYEAKKYLKGQKYLFFKGFIFYTISLLMMFVIPLIAFYAVGETQHLPILTSLIATIYIYLVCSYVPIPGGTVGFEFGFITFFGFIIGGPIVKAGMLLWRFVTYYFIVVVGAIIFLIDRKE